MERQQHCPKPPHTADLKTSSGISGGAKGIRYFPLTISARPPSISFSVLLRSRFRQLFAPAPELTCRHRVARVEFPEARMLKTIKKFVVERRKLVRQRRQQITGEANSGDASSQSGVPPPREGDNGDPLSHPEVPPQLAETQLVSRPRRRFGVN